MNMHSARRSGGFGVGPKKQRGAIMLLGAIMGLSIITGVVVLQMEQKIAEQHLTKARESGTQLRMYNHAVSRRISDGTGAGSYTGVNWLKHINCAPDPSTANPADWAGSNPEDDYLTCAFPDTTAIGQTFSTTVIVDPATTRITATTIMTTPPGSSAQRRGAAQAALRQSAAGGATGSVADPTAGTFTDYELDQTNGNVTATASTNISNDAWLRTDGSNSMLGSLNMNGNDIIGVGNITSTGTVNIGGNMSVTGTLSVAENVAFAKDLTVTGNMIGNGTLAIDGAITGKGDLTLGDSTDTSSRPKISFRFGGGAANKDVQLVNDAEGVLTATNADNDAILSADRVYIAGSGRFASTAIYYASIVKNGAKVRKPVCTHGQAPQVFVSVSGYAPFQEMEIYGMETGAGDWPGDNAFWVVWLKAYTNYAGGSVLDQASGTAANPHLKAKLLVITKCT